MNNISGGPPALLEVVVKKLDLDPALEALDVGFETGEWRAAAFAAHLIEWLAFCANGIHIICLGLLA